jgi:molybdopterin-guanine dinucleotide biosynthesis protein A
MVDSQRDVPPEAEGAPRAGARGGRAEVHDDSITGVVLCGGQSRRMGRDKALIELDGESLVARATRTLAAVCDEVWLATGSTPRYVDLGLHSVLDALEGAGPLAGLTAALGELDREWLAVLACDLPQVDARLFADLRDHARRENLDACLAETPGGREPLCAVYRRSCAPAAQRALASGERRMVSFWEASTDLKVGTLRARCGDPGLNLNTPQDLERALGEALQP